MNLQQVASWPNPAERNEYPITVRLSPASAFWNSFGTICSYCLFAADSKLSLLALGLHVITKCYCVGDFSSRLGSVPQIIRCGFARVVVGTYPSISQVQLRIQEAIARGHHWRTSRLNAHPWHDTVAPMSVYLWQRVGGRAGLPIL